MNITFQIQGRDPVCVPCEPGENLLELMRRAEISVDAPCSGSGTCGKCRVKLLEGSLDSAPSRHISPEEYAQGWRLSCASRINGDCTVLVPEAAAVYRTGIQTAELQGLPEYGVDNAFRRIGLTLPVPGREDTAPDAERVVRGIKAALSVSEVTLPLSALRELGQTLRANDFHICVKGRLEGGRFICMEVCSPQDTAMLGCAIDIGTTTVTAILADLESGAVLAKASCGNAQIAFGADVIGRIIAQGRPGGRDQLQKSIIEDTLLPLMDRLCRGASVSHRNILRICIAANTTMNHLLLGVDADPIRKEPYIPGFFEWKGLQACELGLLASPAAQVVIAPNVGSYVGGDITAGVLASKIWDREDTGLLIDLGTNGELVLGGKDFLIGCACSAGPALEGGGISCGMRATHGAIEACSIDTDMQPHLTVVGGGKPAGICGSGIIHVVDQLFQRGIIDAKGCFIGQDPRVKRDAYGMGRYVLADAKDAAYGREVSVTEADIDNFIRTKAAICAAIDILLKSVDMTEHEIRRVYVAGGIGSGICADSAVRVGMLPAACRDKFCYLGNTALAGAYAMTVSDDAIAKVDTLAQGMTYLELSSLPGYMDAFVAGCFLPHTDKRRFVIE